MSGGWSGVAGGFLNNGQTGPPASEGGKTSSRSLASLSPCDLGLAQPGKGTEMVKVSETDRDREMVTKRDGEPEPER